MSDTETQTPETTPETQAKKRQMTFTVLDDGTVRADFPDSGLEAYTFNPSAIPEALYPDALTEGVINRLRGHMGKLVGGARTPEAMRQTLIHGWETIQKGVWKIEREAGVGTFSAEVEAAWLFRQKRAVAAGQPIESVGTLAESATAYAQLSDKNKAKLKATPLYKAAYAEIRARNALANASKLQKKAGTAEDTGFF